MKKKQKNNDIVNSYLKYGHLGITFLIVIGIFLTLGYFIDEMLGTNPWVFAFSVFPGLISGIYILYKELIIKNDKK